MDIRVSVPESGHLTGDVDAIVRLRTMAGDVGSSSFEVEDDQGVLSIVLHFPSFDRERAKEAARGFAEQAGFGGASVGVA